MVTHMNIALLAAAVALSLAAGHSATAGQANVDQRGKQHDEISSPLNYLDTYRLLLQNSKKCYTMTYLISNIDVDGQIYPDGYAEINIALHGVLFQSGPLAIVTIRPAQEGSTVDLVLRHHSPRALRMWTDWVAGKPACTGGAMPQF